MAAVGRDRVQTRATARQARQPRLTIQRTRIDGLVLGGSTAIDGRTLVVDGTALAKRAQASGGETLAGVRVEVASPGDPARIVHVLDALPVLAKTDGPGGVFPGLLGPPVPSGCGTLRTLESAAVLVCVELPWGAGGLLVAREALVDMAGPAAHLSPFGATHNVVLRVDLAAGHADVEYEAALRRAGLAVVQALGEVLSSAAIDEETVYELGAVDPDLPRIAYVHQVQSQGLYARTYLYGKEMDGISPTVIHPNELFEGALVSGNFVYGAFKTPTWLHANLPLVRELYAGHGREHAFAGVVLSRGHHYTAWEKERSASLAAHQARLLGADGVAITWEGGGNSITDAMLTIRACERLGIRTGAVAYEMGAEDAADVLLLDAVPEADALVSTGGTDNRGLTLPRVERVLGGDRLRTRPDAPDGGPMPAEGPIAVENRYMLYCAAGQTGFGREAGVPY